MSAPERHLEGMERVRKVAVLVPLGAGPEEIEALVVDVLESVSDSREEVASLFLSRALLERWVEGLGLPPGSSDACRVTTRRRPVSRLVEALTAEPEVVRVPGIPMPGDGG